MQIAGDFAAKENQIFFMFSKMAWRICVVIKVKNKNTL